MIKDPYYLANIVEANANINVALHNLVSDDPDYEEKHDRLKFISKQIESLIMLEVVR